MPEIHVLTDAITSLGESPIWDVEEQRLYWVDNMAGNVFRSTPDGREIAVWHFPRLVTSIALRSDGGAVVTSGRRLFLFDFRTGETESIFRADAGPMVGFNDAKVDRQGRFVTGTADGALLDPKTVEEVDRIEPAGRLYRLDADLSVTPLADGIGLMNGPCFSPDGGTFYCNDSWARRVYAYDYDVTTGEASNRRVLATFEGDRAVPDGATVDEEGCLWIAAFSGAEIRRYGPDGTVDRRIPMPVSSPTSVAFGGADLDVLFVTSQGDAHLPGDTETAGLLAGRIFAIHGLGVRGLPERRFAG